MKAAEAAGAAAAHSRGAVAPPAAAVDSRIHRQTIGPGNDQPVAFRYQVTRPAFLCFGAARWLPDIHRYGGGGQQANDAERMAPSRLSRPRAAVMYSATAYSLGK